MKIVYCIAGTYNSGGMERVLANKANWLVNHGYDVSIVTTDQRGLPSFFSMDQRIRLYDLRINYELNTKSFCVKSFSYIHKQLKHYWRLSELLKIIQPDIVVSMFCHDVNVLPKIKFTGHKVLEVHFSRYKRLQYNRRGIWGLLDKLMFRLDEKVVSKYDKFVVLTEEDYLNWGEKLNMVVIPNAIMISPDQESDLTAKVVLAIGRLTYQKGFDRLIEAWSICVKRFPEWILNIVGSGEDEAKLRELIDKNGLSGKVNLMPSTKDINKAYLSSSILVMSSRYEGLPMVLLEAQAYGLPIVSFDCKCGPKDVVSDGIDGYLVPEGDVQALADKLSFLMFNDHIRHSFGRAAKHASGRYSETAIMEQWDKLFRSLSYLP